MRRAIILLLSGMSLLASEAAFSADSDSIPVKVTPIATLTPVNHLFTGQAQSIQSGKISFPNFNGSNRRIIQELSIGDNVLGPVYNADGTIETEGTLIAKLANEPDQISYQLARDKFERDQKMAKAVIKADYESDYLAMLNAKTILSGTYCYALYPGVITGIDRVVGMGVGGAGDSIATLTRMDPIVINVPFTAGIVEIIKKDNPIYIYPIGFDEPVLAWAEKDPGNKEMINAYVHNYISINPNSLSKEQLKMPKVYDVFPIVEFNSDKSAFEVHLGDKIIAAEEPKTVLGITVSSVRKDEKGSYVLKAVGQAFYADGKGIATQFQVEKVYIQLGNLRKYFSLGSGQAVQIADLKDPGTLNLTDIIVNKGETNITDKATVVYVEPKWLFLPGDTVNVEIPSLAKPGFYVPQKAIIHQNDATNYVYIVNDGKASLVQVTLTGITTEGYYGISGKGITAGTQVVVIDDKSLYFKLYDGASVSVKETIPPGTSIEHKRAIPILPYENIKFFSDESK